MHLSKWFKKQNWGIKIGYISLVISLVALALGLILIGTANFVPEDANMVDPKLTGNGFEVMAQNGGVSAFLSQYGSLHNLFKGGANRFTSAPLEQLVSGIVFLVILLPIFGGVGVLALAGGYFKRWLYT